MLGVLVLVSMVLGAQRHSPTIPTSASDAIRKYQAAVADADIVQAKAVEQARIRLVSDLKAAQKAALERGDVDGATTIALLGKENSTPVPGRQAFVGATFKGLDWQITLLPDGTIKHSHPQFGGTWAVVGRNTVAVMFSHGYVDLWTVDETGRSFKAAAFKFDRNYPGTVTR